MLGAGLDISPAAVRAVRSAVVGGVPALDLSFMYGALDPRVTFSRPSAAWVYDGATLTSFASNAPRLTSAGFLIEGAATNLLLNSAALATQSVTVTAAAHTLSFYGTGTVTLSGASTAGPLVGTAAAARVSLTFTPTAGSLTLTVSGDVRYASLELGSGATSPIVTAGAPVLRSAEVATVAVGTFGFNAAEGAIVAEYSPAATTSGRVLQIDDGGTVDRFIIFHSGANVRYRVDDGSVTQVQSDVGPFAVGGVNRVAAAYKLNDFAVSLNGGAAAVDVAGTVPTVTTLRIGCDHSGTSQLNGWMRRLRYFDARLSDAALQGIAS